MPIPDLGSDKGACACLERLYVYDLFELDRALKLPFFPLVRIFIPLEARQPAIVLSRYQIAVTYDPDTSEFSPPFRLYDLGVDDGSLFVDFEERD